MRRTALIVLGLGVALLPVGCGKKGGDGGGGPSANTPARQETPTSGTEQDPSIGPLTEKELKAYIEVWPELARRIEGLKSPRSPLGAIAWSEEFRALLASKGLTVEQYVAVQARVARALIAAGIQESLEKADKTDPQARAMMEAMFAPFKDVPQENIDLVRKHKAQLEALGGSGAEKTEAPEPEGD